MWYNIGRNNKPKIRNFERSNIYEERWSTEKIKQSFERAGNEYGINK